MQMSQTNYACTLGALGPEERTRLISELWPRVRSANRLVHELEDGYEIQFLEGRAGIPVVADWLAMEARCCAFFDLSMSVRGDGPVVVRITGAAGVKEFVQEELPGILDPTG